ncbi:hypothetical protein Salat_2078200 [Sesamum alatum]|uniref:Uncharacterized protein n=1 Tax=Sesamum alatum TaxID=300844 RepID=A0AAE2CGJ4_9LAMI|nr:hypothetical protein Salat_2078200 [Sesamum alatum]
MAAPPGEIATIATTSLCPTSNGPTRNFNPPPLLPPVPNTTASAVETLLITASKILTRTLRRDPPIPSNNRSPETGAENNDDKGNSKSNGVKSQRLRGLVEGRQQNGGVERRAKRKVWISLSREEIEEDVYALTGGRPARRPRRWPKNVQKQLDNVFPGLYLVGVAADSYRVMMLWYGLLFVFFV